MSTAHLVVVDNEQLTADVLAAALMDAGYSVVTAAHGLHALERLEEFPETKLVIAEFRLPKLDGAGLLRAMRQHAIHYKTLCILMSSLPETHVRRYTTSHVAFIQKPFRLNAVVELVAFILSGGRMN